MTSAVRITIPAEHVPVLRDDLRNLLAIEADNVVTYQRPSSGAATVGRT